MHSDEGRILKHIQLNSFIEVDAVYQHAEDLSLQTYDTKKVHRNLGWQPL